MNTEPDRSFDAFRQRVLDDPLLQARLRDLPDRATFIQRVVEVGAEAGYAFTAADVLNAMQQQRMAFLVNQKRILPWMYLN